MIYIPTIPINEIDVSSNNIFSFVNTINDLVKTTNFLTSTGWKDNIQLFYGAKGKGTSEPVWKDTGNGIFGMHFSVDDELFVFFHVDHDYKVGTNGYPHVHWFSDASMLAGDSVVWRLYYVIAKGHQQGGSLLTTPQIIDLTYTATGNELIGEHMVTECTDLQSFDLIEPDAIIMMGVKLLSEDIPGNVFGLMCDLHYLSDREVTPSKTPDFYT